MATYGYKAITKAGKEVKGSLEADNKDLAMAELRRQELTVRRAPVLKRSRFLKNFYKF